MAKKVNRPAAAQNVSPGKNPYANSQKSGRRMGNLIGALCLLSFIVFDELWIGILITALAFGILFAIQVHDKVVKWYASPFLYAVAVTLVMAYVEYAYQLFSNLIDLTK